jgi:SAM-dependent methyltransferase
MNIINKNIKYIYCDYESNESANIIVPLLLKHISPRNVVDIGCGSGMWLRAFKNNGVAEILGLDGQWHKPDLLFKHIDKSEFMCVDLEQPFVLPKIYDLVICLEVAEHISQEHANDFVQSLVNAGKIILFSAAIPAQGGFNHINEQWTAYWIKKFEKFGYYFHDIIRPEIWNNSNIEFWYKQNMFLVSPKNHLPFKDISADSYLSTIVHPDMYLNKQRYIIRRNSGIKQFIPPVLLNLGMYIHHRIKFRNK